MVDDDPLIRASFVRRLTQRGFQVEVAENGAQALKRTATEHFDLVLLDQMMPGMNGIDVLRLLRATLSQGDLPVIMLTGVGEIEFLSEALAQGANDYVLKPADLLAVSARIKAQITRSRTEQLARGTDALTGLYNRVRFLDAVKSPGLAPGAVGVLCLHLDGFQAVYEGLGHQTGEALLQQAARRLEKAAIAARTGPRRTALARLAGAQFAVLLKGAQPEEIARLAEAVLRTLTPSYLFDGEEVVTTVSIGVTLADAKETAPAEELLYEADLAMQEARRTGKNRWHRFEHQLRENARAQMSLLSHLRRAVERRELLAVYQPMVDLATREVVGFECLLRWHHAGHGWVPPLQVIAMAEETGLIVPIGRWILEQACRQLRIWQQRFPRAKPLEMSVNLSFKQLADPGLTGHARLTLAESGVVPGTVSLELTESALMDDVEATRKTLAALQALGIKLKLDDFGTGYSSLSYLQTLQLNTLKIDRSFVTNLGSGDLETRAIIGMMIGMAHSLEMDVVAEGIEQEREAAALARMGCETGQGYYFAKPLGPEEIEKLLENWTARAGDRDETDGKGVKES